MDRQAYNTARWRELPRTECVVERLLGDAAGPCRGLIHRHHVDPTDPDSRTVNVCAGHHPKLHLFLRRLGRQERRCGHHHPYPGGREACERKLNRL